ncbi:MAG: hypothetical protein B0D92_00340 [Spirochaeta sp. LUC14_002_19_P3]|nr:MAG: hypothetical protein B0D92_00340 [Spirochaeta sp. LUC14_002_19_P3]
MLKKITTVIVYTLMLLLLSCQDKSMPTALSADNEIMDFLRISADENTDQELRYAVLEPVISTARNLGEFDWLTSFLGAELEKYPDNPYGAYYLMAMAENARDTGSEVLALDYLRRLVKNYPDIVIRGQSLHLLALGEIALHTHNPYEAIAARLEMNQRFSNPMEVGVNQYYLAKEYKKIGDWNKMFASYAIFLKNPNAQIPGVPDARSNVMDALQFHYSSKSWTAATLDDLINTIKYAIQNQNAALLRRYQSEKFFLMNWSQETSDSFTHIPMTLGTFLSRRVQFKEKVDDYSNENEAYLWTTGWTWKIPTWYLYFRRVDYPVNPEIHGRWEWAGIYLGERL